MQSTLEKRTVATIDAEIAQLRPLAEAEKALDAVGSAQAEQFRGASDRLQALEVEHEDLAMKDKGEALLHAMERLEIVLAEEARSASEQREAELELRAMESLEVIMRWKAARGIAYRTGVGQRWDGYERWVNSFQSLRSVNQYLPEEAPDEIKFSDSEVEAVRSYLKMTSDLRAVYNQRESAAQRRQALLREQPYLEAVAQGRGA